LTYLERQKCYGLDKKILFRKTIIWPWLTLRSKYHEGHYDMRHPHTWMILFKNNYLTLRSKSHKGHYGMWHTALWSFTHILEWYYLKNNYLTLRSKVKVPRRSLRYATHRLMVMHPHTEYHFSIKVQHPGFNKHQFYHYSLKN
jgi:hypothetical protein